MLLGYSARSLTSQRSFVLPGLLAVIVSVGGVAAMMTVFEGMVHVIGGGPPTGNVVIVNKQAQFAVDSRFKVEALPTLAALPDIAIDNGKPQISFELIEQARAPKKDGVLGEFMLRGVDDAAFTLRPYVQITSGERPTEGSGNVLIGEGLQRFLLHGDIGDRLRVGKSWMRIVGTFRSPGTTLDSEAWVPRRDLNDAFNTNRISYALAKLSRPDGLSEMRGATVQRRDVDADVISERDFDRRAMKRLAPVLDTLFALILVLSVGATLACASTMYGLFLSRLRELSTLMAIGFTRRQVAYMMWRESLILALFGGAVGLCLALMWSGHTITLSALNVTVVYPTIFTARALVVGVSSSLLIGVLGGALAIAQILRLNILSTLRSG